jgi:hypothetical protein
LKYCKHSKKIEELEFSEDKDKEYSFAEECREYLEKIMELQPG